MIINLSLFKFIDVAFSVKTNRLISYFEIKVLSSGYSNKTIFKSTSKKASDSILIIDATIDKIWLIWFKNACFPILVVIIFKKSLNNCNLQQFAKKLDGISDGNAFIGNVD